MQRLKSTLGKNENLEHTSENLLRDLHSFAHYI